VCVRVCARVCVCVCVCGRACVWGCVGVWVNVGVCVWVYGVGVGGWGGVVSLQLHMLHAGPALRPQSLGSWMAPFPTQSFLDLCLHLITYAEARVRVC
jgi:hypothetical protein